MGDRGNVAIIQNTSKDRLHQVWVYTHWTGTDLPAMVREGIRAGRPRWNDSNYLTKIIIGRIIPGEDMLGETGYGIGCTLSDNEHTIIVVDIPNKRVFLIDESQLDKFRVPRKVQPDEEWTFEGFLSLQELPEI